jgi:uncharacterized membrane protein
LSGLNLLMAADVVGAVAPEPALTGILGLDLPVLIRTFVGWFTVCEN